jgi:hypothetical protein
MTYSVAQARLNGKVSAPVPGQASGEVKLSAGMMLLAVLLFDALLIGGLIGLWHLVAWVLR